MTCPTPIPHVPARPLPTTVTPASPSRPCQLAIEVSSAALQTEVEARPEVRGRLVVSVREALDLDKRDTLQKQDPYVSVELLGIGERASCGPFPASIPCASVRTRPWHLDRALTRPALRATLAGGDVMAEARTNAIKRGGVAVRWNEQVRWCVRAPGCGGQLRP